MSSEIKHHPDATTLVSYAAATLEEPLAAVVASHVAMCPHCRAAIADLEHLGAALMVTMPRGSQEALHKVPRTPAQVARIELARDVADGEKLPVPLAAAYDLTMNRIPWRRLGPGAWHHRLALREKGEGDLRLLRIAPGRTMPDHGHGGSELTLVLDGSYSDVTGKYGRGDVQDVDEGIEHQPVISMGSDCICLIASVRPARFKSLIGRLSQPWTGL